VPFIYDEIKPFSGGLAYVGVKKEAASNPIADDESGPVVVVTVGFGSGFDSGFVDKTGNVVVPLGYYDSAGRFTEGFAPVIKDGKRGYIDTTGKLVIPCIYDYTHGYFNEGLTATQKDGLWSVWAIVKTFAATPANQTIAVNGEDISIDSYIIDDAEYFKLRDLAYILSGTEKQFEITWDGANNAISITSGEPYTAVGGEMTSKGAGDKTATPTTSKITLDGKEINLKAYNIEGNNYVKINDMAQALNFYIFLPEQALLFSPAAVTAPADEFEIEVPTVTPDGGKGKIFVYRAVRQNGNWVLDSFYYSDNFFYE